MRPTIAHILGGREMGGIATVVFSLLQEQRRSSNAMLVLLEDSELAQLAKRKGFTTEVIPATPLAAPICLYRLVRLLRSKRVALIHTHSVLAHIYGYFIKRCMKPVSFLAHVHASIHRELLSKESIALKRVFYYHATLNALKGCDALIANSKAVRDDLVARGIDAAKIEVIYNGVDVDKLQREAGSSRVPSPLLERLGQNRIIGTLGRFTPIKNQKLLLRAARVVVDELPDVMFLLVGEGKERGNLERMGRELGLEGNLIFTGWLNSPYPLLSCMDILVLPSLWEGLGVTILEAMALGKPVIATDVGGVPEVVRDGETGFLVASGDVDGLASALLRLLSDPQGACDMGRRGRAVVEQDFSNSRMSQQVENLYESLINGKGKQPGSN